LLEGFFQGGPQLGKQRHPAFPAVGQVFGLSLRGARHAPDRCEGQRRQGDYGVATLGPPERRWYTEERR
jgi:hypothetical protein